MTKLRAITQPITLARMTYERLHDSIIHGKLIPGKVYNEMTLAKDLRISRTPVREALLELSAQGLVTFLPRKGVKIRNFTQKDVEEIFELRRVIELAAIEKVAKANPPCNLTRLKMHIDDQKKAALRNDFTAFMKADRAFHATFCELANNQRLVQVLENMRDLIHFMGLQGLSMKGRSMRVIKEHEEVFEAIKERNHKKARKAMESHLDFSEQAVLQFHNYVDKTI